MPPQREATPRLEISLQFLSGLAASGKHPATIRLYDRMIQDLASFLDGNLRSINRKKLRQYAARIWGSKTLGFNARNQLAASRKKLLPLDE